MVLINNFLSGRFWLHAEQLFAVLNREERILIEQNSDIQLYKRGDIIFREGAIPKGIYIIQSGKVKKYKKTLSRGQQIIYLCIKDDVLGYHSALAEVPYPNTAAPIEDTELMFIPREVIMILIKQSDQLNKLLIRSLAHEFNFYVSNMAIMATKSVKERLALQLLLLEEKYTLKQGASTISDIKISRLDLASLVGTATETLVRMLNDFKNEGYIEKHGKSIRITNRRELIREANLVI